MKLNWLICVFLLGVFLATTQLAVVSIVVAGAGAETEAEIQLRVMTAGVVVFLVWFFNLGIYTMWAKFLPVHPFLRQSLVFFRKRMTAWFILFSSLWAYSLNYISAEEWMLAAGCGIAATIVWEKMLFPWEFYKAHVVEYEGHLKEHEKKSKKPLDKDHEDQ